MSEFPLTAASRNAAEENTQALRAEGKVPAVMYGFDIEPTNLTVDRNELERLFAKAGFSSVLNIDLSGTPHNVLIQDLQRDPLTDFITHADFRSIDMNKKVETSVRISLIGVSPAVKDLGGTLVQSLEEVDVEALPSALVAELEIDVSTLATFDDALHVSDIVAPDGMEILTDKEQTVATVQEPRKVEDLEALDAPIEEQGEAEVVGEKKDEAEEGEGSKEGESNE